MLSPDYVDKGDTGFQKAAEYILQTGSCQESQPEIRQCFFVCFSVVTVVVLNCVVCIVIQ